MSRELKRELSTEIFIHLQKIFKEKTWEIEDDDSNQLSLFNRFCTLLSGLSLEEQQLTLELTERFTWIKIDDYLYHIKEAIKNFTLDGVIDMKEINRIYVAPLIAPGDFGKTKSSTTVQYLFRAFVNYMPSFGSKNIIYTDDLEVESDQINRDGRFLLVVDDFIGTGETACSAIDYLINERKVDKEKIVILSIASLNHGAQELSMKKVHHYSSIMFNKGITDYYSSEDLNYKLSVMDSIEKKIKAHKKERLGYNKSEALITLIRTPNNTFPLFWKEKGARVAPFPRN